MSSPKQKLSHTTKYLFLACVFLLTVSYLIGNVLMTQSKIAMKELMQESMLNAASTAAAALDGDELASIKMGDDTSNSEAFLHVRETLQMFLFNMNVKYIYTVKYLNGKNFVFLVDSDPIDPGHYGEPVVYTEALYKASQGQKDVDDTPFTDRWGNFYSAYCPVYTSDGALAGIVAVDYDARWFEDKIAINTASILFITVVSMIIGGGIIVFITTRFRKKIKSLSREMEELENDIYALNKELAANVNLQKTTNPLPSEADLDLESPSYASSFEALSSRIHKAKEDIKEYVSYVREQDYVDPLTGVGNKAAFLEYAKGLDVRVGDEKMNYSVILFDVSNVKSANEKYGMKIGDQMILDASTVLLRAFTPQTVFRIGDDDFIVVLEDTNQNGVNRLLDELFSQIAVFNACETSYDVPLALTSGSATFDSDKDRHCNDVVKRAMQDLSASKVEFYKNKNDRRKR